MLDMSIQERYNDICAISGLSEDIVRRVLSASRKSLTASLKKGRRATLPGICTMVPETRNKLNVGGDTVTRYIKIKSKPSNAMESELAKLSSFETSENKDTEGGKLNIVDSVDLFGQSKSGIRTTQISALL